MRILNLTAVFPPEWSFGGPVHSIYALARAMTSRGHNVTTLTTKPHQPPDSPADTDAGCNGCGPVFRFLRRRGIPFYSPELRSQFRLILGEHDVVLANGNWSYINYIARVECGQRQIPYVIYPRGTFDPWAIRHHSWRKRLWWILIERINYQRARAIVALSRAEVAQIRTLGIGGLVAVIPNGIDPRAFEDYMSRDELEHQYPQLNGKKLILYLGRLHGKKGLDRLLSAFHQIVHSAHDRLLVLAGPDERGYEGILRRMVAEMGLAQRVVFLGLITGRAKTGFLHAAQVFVLPSHGEGLPMAVLEALACACPVVITRRCNLPEVEDVQAGMVVRPIAAEIATALNELLLNPAKAAEMGVRGKRLVEQRFTWTRIAQQTEALCETLAAEAAE